MMARSPAFSLALHDMTVGIDGTSLSTTKIEIGLRERPVLERMVPVIVLIKRIVVRVVDGSSAPIRARRRQSWPQRRDELGYGGGIAADVGGWRTGARRFLEQRRGDPRPRRRRAAPGAIGGQSATSAVTRCGLLLHHFARPDEIDRPFAGSAMSDLQRSMHDLFHVARRAQLIVVFHVRADDAALIRDVLDPLDEFIAAAGRLRPLG